MTWKEPEVVLYYWCLGRQATASWRCWSRSGQPERQARRSQTAVCWSDPRAYSAVERRPWRARWWLASTADRDPCSTEWRHRYSSSCTRWRSSVALWENIASISRRTGRWCTCWRNGSETAESHPSHSDTTLRVSKCCSCTYKLQRQRATIKLSTQSMISTQRTLRTITTHTRQPTDKISTSIYVNTFHVFRNFLAQT